MVPALEHKSVHQWWISRICQQELKMCGLWNRCSLIPFICPFWNIIQYLNLHVHRNNFPKCSALRSKSVYLLYCLYICVVWVNLYTWTVFFMSAGGLGIQTLRVDDKSFSPSGGRGLSKSTDLRAGQDSERTPWCGVQTWARVAVEPSSLSCCLKLSGNCH